MHGRCLIGCSPFSSGHYSPPCVTRRRRKKKSRAFFTVGVVVAVAVASFSRTVGPGAKRCAGTPCAAPGPGGEGRRRPARDTGLVKRRVEGDEDLEALMNEKEKLVLASDVAEVPFFCLKNLLPPFGS